jgi:agmatinase
VKPARTKTGKIAILGVPSDENSSFLRGAAQAPPQIRRVLHDGASNLNAESGPDLAAESRLLDLGDLELAEGPGSFLEITQAIDDLLSQGLRVICLGGDHAITYPIIQAYSKHYSDLNILHLDAHPDLYDEFEGNRLSHACPFARIMEEKLAAHLVQAGIRLSNQHQREQADRFGVLTIEMRDWHPGCIPDFSGPTYLSVDLDALDPAFAAGVSHHEPGGFSTRDVLTIIQNLDAPLVGADIVELNPSRDPQDITARVAAKLLKEIVANML